jgi:hypothetical protein
MSAGTRRTGEVRKPCEVTPDQNVMCSIPTSGTLYGIDLEPRRTTAPCKHFRVGHMAPWREWTVGTRTGPIHEPVACRFVAQRNKCRLLLSDALPRCSVSTVLLQIALVYSMFHERMTLMRSRLGTGWNFRLLLGPGALPVLLWESA